MGEVDMSASKATRQLKESTQRSQSFGIALGPVPILPLPLDLSHNPRFCAFQQRGTPNT